MNLIYIFYVDFVVRVSVYLLFQERLCFIYISNPWWKLISIKLFVHLSSSYFSDCVSRSSANLSLPGGIIVTDLCFADSQDKVLSMYLASVCLVTTVAYLFQ